MSGWGVISILLHVLTITVLVYLFYSKPKARFGEDVEEVERLLKKYTDEMKRDNERTLAVVNEKLPYNQNQNDHDDQKLRERSFEQELKLATTDSEYAPPPTEDGNEQEVTLSKEAKALKLYHEGVHPRAIAKQLAMGNGEIDLLIKVQEQSAHH